MNNIINIPKQLVIIGGGASIREGIEKGLWNKLNNKFIFGLNYSYKYFPNPTVQIWVDKDFYPKHKENLSKIPLVIGQEEKKIKAPNMILFKNSINYNRDLKNGVYKVSLCGIFALSIGIYLLNEGEIFLLGYDFGELRKKDYEKFAKSKDQLNNIMIRDKNSKPLTHFYQEDIKHRGIGKISYYNSKNRAIENFGVFKNEQKVKIYNVSMVSKIPNDIFEKISYKQFFKKLDDKQYDQSYIRQYIKDKLK